MIQIENAGYRTAGRSLVDSVSWMLQPGQFHVIIGANGAGKSTLMRLISGSLPPTSGRILWDGMELDDHRRPERDRGVLMQHHSISFPVSVEEVIMMGRYPHFRSRPGETDRRIVREVTDEFGLGPFADRNIQTLSGGEQQRVHFARVWAQMTGPKYGRSKMLLLDEPTTYLDLRYQWKYLRKIVETSRRENWTTVAVLHDLNLAYRMADRILLLHEGAVLSEGTPKEILTPDNVRKGFGVDVVSAEGGIVIRD